MKTYQCDLPKEWAELVREAMNSNITKESFKLFIKQEKEKKMNHYPDKLDNKK